MANAKVQKTKSNTFINIPKEIREHLKLSKGDVLNFRIKDNGDTIIKKRECN